MELNASTQYLLSILQSDTAELMKRVEQAKAADPVMATVIRACQSRGRTALDCAIIVMLAQHSIMREIYAQTDAATIANAHIDAAKNKATGDPKS